MKRLLARNKEGDDDEQNANRQRDTTERKECPATGGLCEVIGAILSVWMLTVRETLITEKTDDQSYGENTVAGLGHCIASRRCGVAYRLQACSACLAAAALVDVLPASVMDESRNVPIRT